MTRVAHLSVTIATLDRPEALARCLDALLSGAVLPGEVVVVDQSRDDATKTIIERRQGNGVPIVYVRQQRRGLSASRNAALAQVSHPIVAVTDDDCVPDPGWIAAIERVFRSPTAPHALTGRVLPLGPEVPGTYVVATRESPVGTEFSGKALPWLIGSGNNFAVKRDWFVRIGGCDERLGVGSPGKAAEDMDLFYRLLRVGARIRYEPDALVYHERTSKTRRLATRWSYGYGLGAFCSLWLRRGDLYALRVLGYWLCWQCLDLTVATGRRQWLEAYQRWLSLRGTAAGLIYGLKVNLGDVE
jgi:GT2 family glycosyltransferase